jgi:hypothetical protein
MFRIKPIAPERPVTVFIVEKPNSLDYRIDGVLDPTLELVRGETYTFDFVDDGHPFYIKSALGYGTLGSYDQGITNQGSSSSARDLVFTVPQDAPDLLYYQCSAHYGMAGELRITNAVEDDTNDQGFDIESPVIESKFTSLSLIVAPGVLGSEAIYLQGLREIRSDNNWSIFYAGEAYSFVEIDDIVTTVTREGAYTAEFALEIAESYPEYSGITFSETIDLVGVEALADTLLAVASADGNSVA